MFSKIAIGQLCGFLFLFILLTTMLSKSMAGAPLDPEDVPNTLGAVWCDGMAVEVEREDDGSSVTTLTGTVADQAALQGLLGKLYALGLPLISVNSVVGRHTWSRR